MNLTGEHRIGSDRSREAEPSFFGVVPESGEKLQPGYGEATESEIERAVNLAVEAADRGASSKRRATLLRRVADEIEGLGDALLERAHAETALPLGRLKGERGRTVGQLRMFADMVEENRHLQVRTDAALPDRTPIPRPDLRTSLVPLGPVAVFGASNFPLAFSVAGGDTASALAAGCPVVHKAHPAHPGTAELIGEAIARAVAEAELAPGWFSLLHGSSVDVGRGLVCHPSIDGVAFTGSLAGGRALFDLAGDRPRPIPVYAEMGSSNPVFVLPGALRTRGDEIARGLAKSVELGVGQFCTNPGLVIGIAGPDLDAFAGGLEQSLREAAPGLMLHRGIAEAYRRGYRARIDIEGVEGIAGVDEPEGVTARPGLLRTTAAVLAAHPMLADELFGPTTTLVACADRSQMLDVARSLSGQLTATIHGADRQEAAAYRDLVELLSRRAGRLVWNGFPTGVDVCGSMHHGGPYPATTSPLHTSVGTEAIRRFLRPVCYQDFPLELLPQELLPEELLGAEG